jgi:hypothetical protein
MFRLPYGNVYAKFMLGQGAKRMSNFSNDDLPSGNPSPKTVLIVLSCLAIAAVVVTFHSAFGF